MVQASCLEVLLVFCVNQATQPLFSTEFSYWAILIHYSLYLQLISNWSYCILILADAVPASNSLDQLGLDPGTSCQYRRLWFDPWVRKISWRRKWQPTPVFWPGKSHGQRSLVGHSPWGHKESDTTRWLNNNNKQYCRYQQITQHPESQFFSFCFLIGRVWSWQFYTPLSKLNSLHGWPGEGLTSLCLLRQTSEIFLLLSWAQAPLFTPVLGIFIPEDGNRVQYILYSLHHWSWHPHLPT